ncbi:hypothetical protein SUGI_0127120 [Cryptomeria japonica]|uniref:ethylene-responsive transcription factor ERF017-like n=1 Tax=Cryptomeria japonica TaxID=3369 RepID=UPI002408D653|nr:ethylene-responsive transcription factor ERF017-like [Cryptomeria japonica]GLJ10377.1 hypothetical protein SUGI_0127120 [Cryptomeria japonica]
MSTPVKQEPARIPPPDNHGEKSMKFKGIRKRKWGKWVSEVRMPNSRSKIWLGSYDTAEQAARAFDAAIYCLRGPHANLNFPDTIPAIPSASSLSRQQIQAAAAKYARGQIPSTCKNNSSALSEKPFSPPISSTPSEMQTLSDSLLMSEDLDFVLGESLFLHSDSNQLLNLDELLSDDAATSELTSPTGEKGSKFFDASHLWNF